MAENMKLSNNEQAASPQLNQNSDAKNTGENIVKNINVLVQAAVKGQKVGAYSLDEAAVIMDAIKVLQNTLGGNEQPKN